MFTSSNANPDSCTRDGRGKKKNREHSEFLALRADLESPSTHVHASVSSLYQGRKTRDTKVWRERKPCMLLIKETKAVGEDELINFNQTSIFKCWEMITSTGNKIKGPAIAGWRSVPRETSKFIPAWLKLQIWPKWSTELNALRTTLILSCKFPQCLLGATTAPREEIKAKRILILSNHNTFSHTPIYTHR